MVDAWPDLPEAVRDTIRMIIEQTPRQPSGAQS